LQTLQTGFTWPCALTLFHYLVSWAGIDLLRRGGAFTVKPNSPLTPKLLILAAVAAVAPAVSNVSLRLNSVGFYQVGLITLASLLSIITGLAFANQHSRFISSSFPLPHQVTKILVLPAVIIVNRIFYSQSVTVACALALCAVVVGSFVASVYDVELNVAGATVSMIMIPLATAFKVMWARTQKHNKWTSLQLMWRTQPTAVVIMIFLVPILDPPGLLSYQFTPYSFTLIALSGVCGFLINWTAFLVLGETSALTHILLGQLKTCVVIWCGFLFFAQMPSTRSLIGAAVVVLSVVLYTKLNIADQERKRRNTAAIADEANMEIGGGRMKGKSFV
jgi:solute carrier family 35 protein E3